jgi:hypothetical protein
MGLTSGGWGKISKFKIQNSRKMLIEERGRHLASHGNEWEKP